MHRLFGLLVFFVTPAFADPDIFVDPPHEALRRGVEMDYDSKLETHGQGWLIIQEACGDNMGCLTWDGPVCKVHVWLELPEDMELLAYRNLVARCAGWTPVGE